MMMQASKHFLVVEASAVYIYSYEGRLLASPKVILVLYLCFRSIVYITCVCIIQQELQLIYLQEVRLFWTNGNRIRGYYEIFLHTQIKCFSKLTNIQSHPIPSSDHERTNVQYMGTILAIYIEDKNSPVYFSTSR